MAFLNGLFTAALDTNVVFAQLIGMLTVMLLARRSWETLRVSAILGGISLVAGLIGSFFYAGLLQPWGVAYLAPIAFVLIDLGVAFAAGTIAGRGKGHDERYALLRRYALLGASSAVMGVSFSAYAGIAAQTATFESGLGTVIGSALGVFLACALYGFIRDRIDERLVPKAMRGLPIELVTAAIMALAFTGVAGIASGMFA